MSHVSEARGAQVDLFTAVPAGHGTGEGLPVCLVLHGASATAADLEGFGLPRFLTAAVREGVPPFVLVGTDGGRKMWRSSGRDDPDDPQRMLIEEVPVWLAERSFDWDRRAAWGWSMGGAGALLLGEAVEGALTAVAALTLIHRSGSVDRRGGHGRSGAGWSTGRRVESAVAACGGAWRVQRFGGVVVFWRRRWPGAPTGRWPQVTRMTERSRDRQSLNW